MTPMNQNLNLLRQNYRRNAIATGKGTHYLFPLEKECEQGKTLFAKVPNPLLHLQEFSPYGLHQTYRDEPIGLDLPVFAVFDLEGNHQLAFEITTDAIGPMAEPKSLPSYIPFQRAQTGVRKINKSRMKAERAATRISVILGIFPAIAIFFSGITSMLGVAEAGILARIFGSFLAYALSLFVLDRLCLSKKLVLTAEFDGIRSRQSSRHFPSRNWPQLARDIKKQGQLVLV